METDRNIVKQPGALGAVRGFVFATVCLAAAGAWAQGPAPASGSDAGEKPAEAKPTTEEKPYAPPADFHEWANNIKLSAQIEGGIIGNISAPRSGINFGQLFTDKANRPILNQVLLGVGRELDPKATDYDVGFKLSLLYGSDARIEHTLGVFDQLIHDRNQLDVLEANVVAHLPWVFEGGIDVKAGIFPTLLGSEVIDPKPNAFYSHSYIFNYGIPFKHTGVLTTSHVNSVVDVYLGIDSGTNTSLGSGDNNDEPGGLAGFQLTLLDSKLTVVAVTHIGPENATRNTPFGNSALRYYNDVVFTYKATDALTLTTELDYAKEDGFRAEAYGAAQYIAYTLTDSLTLNGRAEVFRDNNNFFVSNPSGNRDFVAAELGNTAHLITAARPTTYSEFTVGVTYKPSGLPEQANLLIRPELRYDRALNNSRPFRDGHDKGVVTLGADIVLGF